ncbi:MAG: acyl-CoA dehydrogenase family protein [Pseudomonadota bacterium]
MTLADRNNPYSFEEFLNKLHGLNMYMDDPFLQKNLAFFAGPDFNGIHERLRPFSAKASGQWRAMADFVARPENRPYLENFNAHNRRVDRLVRPAETRQLEREIFSEGLFSEKTLFWENVVKRFLLHQLGEFGVMCPIACTEGLIALIEQFPDHGRPELDRILRHCKEGLDGDFGVGAQFMSEIQGGSDIPSNLIEAEPQADGTYKLFGAKFFCSAMQADYAVVTAKTTAGDKVGTFIVPSWLPGDKEREVRNGCRINRIKWKMGTAELPTAEIEYDGAAAYAVGPTDRGVANAVGIVLTLSRLTVGVSSASGMMRAAREAFLYSEFRDVFGQKICQFPLGAHQVRELVRTAQRTLSGAFKVFNLFLQLGRKLQPGLNSNEPLEIMKKRFDLRELIIIQKLCTAYQAVDAARKAMSIFGGHGVIEDFSSLPRLYRDAAVNELWEGPRNVLLIQVLRDLHRVMAWYPPEEFTASALAGVDPALVADLGRRLRGFLENPPFLGATLETMKQAAAWEGFVDEFFLAYQERALAEVGPAPIVRDDLIGFPEIWKL